MRRAIFVSSALKNEDKWISSDPRTKKLVIRFFVRGFSKQFFISSGLEDTKRNREIVRLRRDAIKSDIALGRFDHTLESYQFRAVQIDPAALVAKQLEVKYQQDLHQLWERFSEFQRTQIEETTFLGTYKGIARFIKKLPTHSLEKTPEIRDWLLSNTTQLMAWHNLTHFQQCCEWGVQSGLIPDNPFLKMKIQNLKPKKKSTKNNNYRAFTLQQRDIIIQSFEEHSSHCYYASLIKFLFFTGCRLGEAFALTWNDINDNCTRISINKSRNMHGILKGTKNGKSRVFPAANGSKLQKLLQDIKPATSVPADLIFESKTGSRMNSFILHSVWNRSVNHPGVVRELVEAGKIPYYLRPYACRHTFATWAITSGVTPDKVALWIGDEILTVLRYYCHPNVVDAECPDF
ncbi:MAG: tyrosine-type recombinase/integrase [Nostoc sp. GBBB01]|nr:tyrosine-type recombinase/integrase [Nostoc sp. GBBB01]